MRRRIHAENKSTVEIPYDTVNEQVVFAAALVDDEARKYLLAKIPTPEHYQAPEHRLGWAGLLEMKRQNLDFDLATLQMICGGTLNMEYISVLIEARPEVPPNLNFHVEALLWDKARATAITGPIAALLDAIRNPNESADRVKSLARQVAGAFDGYEERSYLLDPIQLAKEQADEIRRRMDGHAIHSYGIPTLDKDENGKARLIPGAAPEQITVITGNSGSGKSTLAARIALGLARQRKKLLYGAWEMKGGITLETLACMSLGYSRRAFQTGAITEEQAVNHHARMEQLGKYIRFLPNAFRRKRGEKKRNNDGNLDILQGYIEDTGCDVFIGDLFKKSLTQTAPDEEEDALNRMQVIAQECKIHAILVQQQRLKDVEQRPDKRPTREGIKGSAAWVEVADTILGVHRPSLWKRVPDNVLEIDILKQRYGDWPIAVQFEFEADTGSIENGVTTVYDNFGADTQTELDTPGAPKLAKFTEPMKKQRNGFNPYRGR